LFSRKSGEKINGDAEETEGLDLGVSKEIGDAGYDVKLLFLVLLI
jgi:hypothetical protein